MHVGSHSLGLALMAFSLATFATYAAVDLADRASAGRGTGLLWAVAAGTTFGVGVWTMHFMGMLAFRLPVPVGFAPYPTYLSFGLGVSVAVTAFVLAWRFRRFPAHVALGAVLGGGMVAMHYVGVEGMLFEGTMSYEPLVASLAVSMAVGTGAAVLPFCYRSRRLGTRAASSLLMGVGMWGMHHLGMLSAGFSLREMHPGVPHPHVDPLAMGSTEAAVAIGAGCFVMVGLAFAGATVDKRVSRIAKRDAAASAEREHLLERLYAKTPVALHALGPEGRIESVTDAWTELLGYSRREVVGRRFAELLDGPSRETYETLSRDGDVRRTDGLRIVSGHGFPLEVSLVEHLETSGPDGGVLLGVVEDTTAVRRQEALLIQTQRMNALGQLTGGVAEEFDAVLSSVLSNAEMLGRRAPEGSELAAIASGLKQSASVGASLTGRLLAFARRAESSPAPVSVEAAVEGMTDLLRRSLGPTLSLETYFPARVPLVFVDPQRLETAILNLAVNARDAMPEGGMIAISARRVDLRPGDSDTHPPGDYVALTVTDTGSGMDERTLRLAREPFYTTKGLGRSAGLGLTVAHAFADGAGGWVDIDSTPGEGTSVTLALPVHEAGAEIAMRDRPLIADAGRLTVLVVEREPLAQIATAGRLRALGHSVVESGSAEEALGVLRNGSSVDLLFVGKTMADAREGIAALAAAAEAAAVPRVVVVPRGADAVSPPGGEPLAETYDAAALREALATAAGRAA